MKTAKLPTLIKVKGSGKPLEGIAAEYLQMMENGFNLTAEEIAEYLRCSYVYVIKNMQQHIRHIVINASVARKALIRYGMEEQDYTHLFTKRKLFYRPDFEQYFLKNAELVTSYERYDLDDLSVEAWEKLLLLANGKESIVQRLFKELVKMATKVFTSSELELTQPLDKLPKRLYSVKDLVTEGIGNRTFKDTRNVYFFLEKYSVKKVRFGSLIRFREDDLQQALEKPPLITLSSRYHKKKILEWVEEQIRTRGNILNGLIQEIK